MSSTGEQSNDHSFNNPVISAGGRYVAFASAASNLVPGDTNGSWDVFVRDVQTRRTSRVSLSSTGAQTRCCAGSADPAISSDGRYVAFVSSAPDLVPGDTNDNYDVFVRDRIAGTTRRVSVSGAGGQTDGRSGVSTSALSTSGRYIAFYSYATNLVPGDTNGRPDVFVRDMQAGTTRRISVSGSGAESNGFSGAPAISANGRYVAFDSDATNLVTADTNGTLDVFLRDWQAGTTRRISVSDTGEQADNDGTEFNGSGTPSISANGRYVTFQSTASNLVKGDTNSTWDVFLRDWRSGVTRRISVSGSGGQGSASSGIAVISPDGRYVAFGSSASNLVPADTNDHADVFLRDWQAGTTRRVSVSSGGAQGNNHSDYAAISTGGRHVAFNSFATNLVPGDTGGWIDMFVRVT